MNFHSNLSGSGANELKSHIWNKSHNFLGTNELMCPVTHHSVTGSYIVDISVYWTSVYMFCSLSIWKQVQASGQSCLGFAIPSIQLIMTPWCWLHEIGWLFVAFWNNSARKTLTRCGQMMPYDIISFVKHWFRNFLLWLCICLAISHFMNKCLYQFSVGPVGTNFSSMENARFKMQ